jgi:hypothetical protein
MTEPKITGLHDRIYVRTFLDLSEPECLAQIDALQALRSKAITEYHAQQTAKGPTKSARKNQAKRKANGGLKNTSKVNQLMKLLDKLPPEKRKELLAQMEDKSQ